MITDEFDFTFNQADLLDFHAVTVRLKPNSDDAFDYLASMFGSGVREIQIPKSAVPGAQRELEKQGLTFAVG